MIKAIIHILWYSVFFPLFAIVSLKQRRKLPQRSHSLQKREKISNTNPTLTRLHKTQMPVSLKKHITVEINNQTYKRYQIMYESSSKLHLV